MSNYSSSTFDEDPNTPWYKVFNIIRPKSRVIDVGCSSGTFGKALIDRKECVVDGVEISEEDKKLAEKKLRKVYDFNIEEGIPRSLEGNYDYVYFGDVIEHLFRPVQALINAKKLLKPGGELVFSVPNMSHISARIMVMSGEFEYGKTGVLDATHLRYYTRNEITRVCAEAGFIITKLDWVKRDIPEAILKRQLEEIGLSPSKKFFVLSRELDSAAYQFIGIAKPTNQKVNVPERPLVSPPINIMDLHLKKMEEEYKSSIQRVEAHYDALLKEKESQLQERVDRSIVVPRKVKQIAITLKGQKHDT